MRKLVFMAGVFGFTAVAFATGSVVFTTPLREYAASYYFAPGTVYQREVPITIQRRFQFAFQDAESVSTPRGVLLRRDENAIVREYLAEDVRSASVAARREADETGANYADLLNERISRLRFQEVDCRLVARRMVETLITHRVVAVPNASSRDGETFRFQARDEAFERAMIARQLARVDISRDDAITGSDRSPHFECSEARVVATGETPACASLSLAYNPLTNPTTDENSPFYGRYEHVFDPEACARLYVEMNEDNEGVRAMALNSCELMFQVRSCGMRYTLRAAAADRTSVANLGLADRLMNFADRDTRRFQEGEIPPGSLTAAPAPRTATVPNAGGGSSTGSVPESFYSRFRGAEGAR